MPFSKLSPAYIFTEKELLVRSFLEEIYNLAWSGEISSADGLREDGTGLCVAAGGCLSVRQELSSALKEKLESLDQKQKDLANILLPVLFKPRWDRAFLHRWGSTGQVFLVRQAH